MRWLKAWAAGLSVTTLSAAAWPYQLRVGANPCASETEVRSRVDRRLRGAPSEAWRFIVEISGVEQGIVAQITSLSPGGGMEARAVRGGECSSVLDAAALVIAVTVDPMLAMSPGLPTPPEVAPKTEGHVVLPRPRPVHWHLGMGGAVGARTAIARTLGGEAALGAVLQRNASPVSEASLEYVVARGSLSRSDLSASLTLQVARARLVPIRWSLTKDLNIGPAAVMELGYLLGKVSGVGGRQEGGRWISVGIELPVSLATPRVDLALVPFIAWPLKRDEFRARGDRLFEVPAREFGVRIAVIGWLD